MKEILITKGEIALVDDEDFGRLSKFHWCFHGDGYAARGFHQDGKVKIIKMHQEVLGSAPEGKVIDHINGNKLDNRKKNLRFVTQQENSFNIQKRILSNPGVHPSRFKGVTWRNDRNKWCSRITVNGKRQYLGLYDKEEDAALAYNAAAKALHGAFANLNKI